ncbi:MAG: glycosyltransferase [Actinomycetota bacterium]|nr:glycosyltransferase [Actinomycetota bacterium]
MTRIAAAIVTHNSAAWLPDTLASVLSQSRPADLVVVVDDASTDGTAAILRDHGIDAIPARSRESDRVTRIAANFRQAVEAARTCDLVVLGDHDDVWHPSRLAHQASIMEATPAALLLASDGLLVDADGLPMGGTLRSTFPIPDGWVGLAPAGRMREVLRHAVATGGASAIRPAAFPTLDVPRGWLHDRWWSLVAAARSGLLLDDGIVIDYRIQPGQQVGLDRAAQAHGPIGRLGALAGEAGRSWGKSRDVVRRLRPMALDEAIAREIRLRNVL